MKTTLLVLILATLATVPTMAATSGNYSDALEAMLLSAKDGGALGAVAQSGSGGHSVALSFTASTSAAGCSSTGTPPCSFGYNVFRGTASGGESATPLNSSPITTTTYTDTTVTLGSSPVTYFYFVEAVETVSGVTVASGPSNEASATFPGIPATPASLGAVPK